MKLIHHTLPAAQRTLVRHGYADAETYGVGLEYAATGPIDAPMVIHMGSMIGKVPMFQKPKTPNFPLPSITNRD